jgi:hypothetical protein
MHIDKEPVEIFTDEEDECHKRSNIDGKQACEHDAGSYIQAWQLDEVYLYRRYQYDKQDEEYRNNERTKDIHRAS